MIEAKLLSPFLQSIADGTVGIGPERPSCQTRDSLRELRLRVVAILNDQGKHRKDWGLINFWASRYSETPRPLRLDLTHNEAMRELTEYYRAWKTVPISRGRLLSIGLYSLGPTKPEEARTIMIASPTIAQSRGFLVLTRRDNPLTEATFGRLLTMRRIFPRRVPEQFAPIFTRFATPSDEQDFSELVACFKQTRQVLPALPSGSQIPRFLKRLERGGFQLTGTF